MTSVVGLLTHFRKGESEPSRDRARRGWPLHDPEPQLLELGDNLWLFGLDGTLGPVSLGKTPAAAKPHAGKGQGRLGRRSERRRVLLQALVANREARQRYSAGYTTLTRTVAPKAPTSTTEVAAPTASAVRRRAALDENGARKSALASPNATPARVSTA